MRLSIKELMVIDSAISDVLNYRDKCMRIDTKEALLTARAKIREALFDIDIYFTAPGVLKNDTEIK